ncbi:TMEM175 family protein [soil metagenome]
MEMLEDKGHERDYALERLIMLSDGVIAIAITLLALELRPPEHWDGGMQTLVHAMARSFGAFLFSFFIIAVYWINHRRMFGRFRSADAGLTVLNLVLLGLMTLVPVVTSLMVQAGPRGAGYVIYVMVLGGIGLVNALIWAWAAFVKPRLFTVEPPRPAKFVVLAVMLTPVVILPILALASMRVTPLWTMAFALLAVVVTRGIRLWGRRHGTTQWAP